MRAKRQTVGYIVKQEKRVKDETNPMVEHLVREDVSRIFHSLEAAREYMRLCQKQWPDGDFYVHERTKAIRQSKTADIE